MKIPRINFLGIFLSLLGIIGLLYIIMKKQEQKMTQKRLFDNYSQNVALIDELLAVNGSFDMLSKKVALGEGELTLYFIDGFAKDTVLQKLIMHILSMEAKLRSN